jgi:hypothetical protein
MTEEAPQRLNRGQLRRRPHGSPIGAEMLNSYSIR